MEKWDVTGVDDAGAAGLRRGARVGSEVDMGDTVLECRMRTYEHWGRAETSAAALLRPYPAHQYQPRHPPL